MKLSYIIVSLLAVGGLFLLSFQQLAIYDKYNDCLGHAQRQLEFAESSKSIPEISGMYKAEYKRAASECKTVLALRLGKGSL